MIFITSGFHILILQNQNVFLKCVWISRLWLIWCLKRRLKGRERRRLSSSSGTIVTLAPFKTTSCKLKIEVSPHPGSVWYLSKRKPKNSSSSAYWKKNCDQWRVKSFDRWNALWLTNCSSENLYMLVQYYSWVLRQKGLFEPCQSLYKWIWNSANQSRVISQMLYQGFSFS